MKYSLFIIAITCVTVLSGCVTNQTINGNTNTDNTNSTVNLNNNTNTTANSTVEQQCVAAGGTWKQFSNGCVDSCNAKIPGQSVCTQAFTNGCECGTTQCWDHETSACITNPPEITNVLPKRVEDTSTTMITTTTGLQYQDTIVGTGAVAQTGDKVTVHYRGTLTDGTEFDASYNRNQPFTFTLGAGQVIAGWDEGVAGMAIGGTRTLIIPPDLGYGDRAVSTIPANSTLQFVVELLEIN